MLLDAGALVAIDRRDRRVGAMLAVAQRQGIPVRTSAAVIAQVWRGARQANLARVLAGVAAHDLDGASARRIGALLATSNTSDVVDAHVAILARPDEPVLTSDAGDLERLLLVTGTRAIVVPV